MVVVMLGLALLTVQEHRSARRSLTAAGQDKLSAVGSLAASAVGAELAGLDELVTAHSRREVAVAAVGAASSEAERDAILEALRTASASIFSSSLYDASGTLLALQPSVPGVVGRNFAFRDWYRGARVSEGAYLSEAFQLMTPAHPWAVASAAAVRDGRGGVVGFLVATYDLSKLQSLVDRFQIEHGVGMTVVDRRGQVLAAPLSGAGTTRTGDRTADVSLLSALGLHTPSPIAAAKAPGQWVVQQVPLVGGVVRVEQPVRAALAGYAGQGQRDRALLGAVLAAALLLVGLVLHTDRRRRRFAFDLP